MQESQRHRALEAFQDFLAKPLGSEIDEQYGQEAELRAIALFQDVAASVPAYQTFLADAGVNPRDVRTFEDFQRLPMVTRQNYLTRHRLPALCRGGTLSGCDMVAVSSGSTGQPTFWPRAMADELPVARRFEQIFRDAFEADRLTTLAVVCFPLGTWVGGMYTASACRYLAAKGFPITTVTPGNQKAEILRVVRELAPHFDQVVLLGYPPFLKDVVDTGASEGVDWRRHRHRLVMAGEVFSEAWRDLMAERLGLSDVRYDTASLYGTADAGVLGTETPLTIAIRRFLAGRPDLAERLFGERRLPTLVQYDPDHRFFEVHEGTLLFTGDNGIPLVRYHIADTGGVMPYDQLLAWLEAQGFDAPAGLARGVHPLPFAWVFGRGHFAVSYFGANVYPENVAEGLVLPEVKGWVTGKFVMEVVEEADASRVLAIAVELAPGEDASEARRQTAAEAIRRELVRLNSEFAHYVPPERQTPRLTLVPHGDPATFPPGVKHRYTRP